MDLYVALVRIHGKEKVRSWNKKEVLVAASELIDSIGETRA